MNNKTYRCPNCGATLGCSCEIRTAKDGTKCCSRCIVLLNNKFDEKKRSEHLKNIRMNNNRRNVLV